MRSASSIAWMASRACYSKPELREDPNMRDFWGPSLDRMWRAVWAEPAALGGAIWGMIDETFALSADLPGRGEWWGLEVPGFAPYDYAGPTIGYGEWGFIDVWRTLTIYSGAMPPSGSNSAGSLPANLNSTS